MLWELKNNKTFRYFDKLCFLHGVVIQIKHVSASPKAVVQDGLFSFL